MTHPWRILSPHHLNGWRSQNPTEAERIRIRSEADARRSAIRRRLRRLQIVANAGHISKLRWDEKNKPRK